MRVESAGTGALAAGDASHCSSARREPLPPTRQHQVLDEQPDPAAVCSPHLAARPIRSTPLVAAGPVHSPRRLPDRLAARLVTLASVALCAELSISDQRRRAHPASGARSTRVFAQRHQVANRRERGPRGAPLRTGAAGTGLPEERRAPTLPAAPTTEEGRQHRSAARKSQLAPREVARVPRPVPSACPAPFASQQQWTTDGEGQPTLAEKRTHVLYCDQ